MPEQLQRTLDPVHCHCPSTPTLASLRRTSTFLSVRKAGFAWIASPISLADCAWCHQTIEQQQQCQGKRTLNYPTASTVLVASSARFAARCATVTALSALCTCITARACCARSAPAWTHLSLCLDDVPLLLLKRLVHLSAAQDTRRAFSSARCTAARARREIRHSRACGKTSAVQGSFTQSANSVVNLNLLHAHRRNAPTPAHSRCTWRAPPPAAPPAWPPLLPRKPASGTGWLCGSECACQSIG